MIFCILCSVFCVLLVRPSAQQLPTIEPSAGLVITQSVAVKPGTYRLAAAADTPALIVRGANITVDFQGAVIEGGDPEADPDGYAGIGLLVDGGSNVTIRNAVIRGYKIALEARGSPRLHLTRNDLSYNWKQRLHSGVEHESLLDWMSYHENEKDEWRRYGAGMYLVECDGAEIDHNTVRQGQNGLMVTRSSGLFIWNNVFQFNSSLGIGLYRVTKSRILHNRIDWNVRGYSHGFYNRGQDSAGLLMYEQSSENIVAYNSVTHSGDGLFLWAGQSTMNTGRGGANDNIFYRNDFSHAPTNGIETTFSRNYFIENRVEENWHGVWGGYSWSSVFDGNRFSRNEEGIAIEHGQDNLIRNNVFAGDKKAIRLWANDTQDPEWGYPKNRDTRSRNYDISYNRFSGHDVALEIDDTVDIAMRGNTFDKVASRLVTTGTTDRLALSIPGVSVLNDPPPLFPLPAPLDDGIDVLAETGLCDACPAPHRGRQFIIVDEWGPYDFRSPKLWPAGEKLRVMGPPGTWKLGRIEGGSLAADSGTVPGEIAVTRAPDAAELVLDLIYTGGEVLTPRGRRIPAGAPSTFSYSRFDPQIDWTVRFFTWPENADPLTAPEAFRKVIDGAPLLVDRPRRLDYMSGRALKEGLPRDRVALVAEGRVTLPPGPAGTYVLRTISDDGVRVWVDGALVIDNWDVHGSEVDSAPLAGGAHAIKVEYFEATGWAELRLEFARNTK